MSRECTGHVYNNPKFDEGAEIFTSRITNVTKNDDNNIVVTTGSGSVYVLGVVDQEYELQYPNAAERLVASYTK